MFGYIRPMKSELLVKDSELYSAVYCGLCRYGGRHISHLTRWMLNYDFVLLALLRISLSGEKPEVCRKRCPYRLRKKNCVIADESFSVTGRAFGLLSYGKLADDIADERGVKRLARRLAKPIYSRIAKKCGGDELESIIRRGLEATAGAESEKCSSPDRAADGSAVMMREIAAYGLEGTNARIAAECGYHIGRFVYLIDAFDDAERDEKSGNYNPFLLYYGGYGGVVAARDEISQTLCDSLNAFSHSYALALEGEPGGIDRLIFNITELGGRAAIRRIAERMTNEKPL